MNNVLYLIVEGSFGCRLASAFLSAAGLPINRINFIVADSLVNSIKLAKSIINNKPESQVAVLIDFDSNDNFESEKKAITKYNLVDSTISVFTAVPEIESWLFADLNAAKTKARNLERASELLSRVSLPDDIPYPKYLATRLFKLDEKFELVNQDININVAASRSPSLRKFITGVGKLLGVEATLNWEREYVRTSGRDIFSKLVDEVTPADVVLYKTLNGQSITAGQMVREIHDGTEIGISYSVEVLRVARDLLSREAHKK
ncbi:DUF4276 family protein [Shewanella sp. JM162201]|uniref:DUF4276 family protein n=1 Tax=Shewanella jiangmenensis TaxID=2837387 RepID=A0ABS5V0L4_9GAMM|nr:DUF4276 family protein [Shewanella jiangmenensis]MBT1443420.1 DUF4276 family protein [Shewanella jiangmenensis]